jgi:regulator of replication initiation timing
LLEVDIKVINIVMKKTNKFAQLSFLLLLVINFIIPLQAFAGVRSKMMEVASEDRKALQECMVGLEECIEDKERIQSSLNSRINDLMSQVNQFRSENADLQKQVNDLRMDNTILVRKIEEIKTSISQKVNEDTNQVQTITSKKNKIDSGSSFCLACKVGHVIGPVVALPIGAVTGTVRGSINKGTTFADQGSDLLGESLPGQLVGKLGGGVLGTVVGAVSGLFRGLYNGLRYGLTRPFSSESFSLAGKFVEDFNPTNFRN